MHLRQHKRRYIKKSYASILSLLTVILLLAQITFADTEVSGIISTDTAWTLAESPYIVTGDINVEEGVKLTIEPGVTIKFDGNYCLRIEGELNAIGTEDGIITFTLSSQALIRWNTIKFCDSSVDAIFDENGNYLSGSIIYYSIIEYAGNSGIFIHGASPFINFCRIRDNNTSNSQYNAYNGGGISVVAYDGKDYLASGGSPIIKNCTIINNQSYGTHAGSAIGTIYSSPIITTNIISENIGGDGSITINGDSPKIKNNNIVSDNIAINWQYGYPQIMHNTIKGGIYITYTDQNVEKGEINYNNLDKYNSQYAISNRPYHGGAVDIDASNNWWGTTDTSVIDDLIYDYYDDFEEGKVNYIPILYSPDPDAPIRPYKKVPTEYLTIQAAIDAASDGDVILVASGTYAEGINFYGKNIVVRSQDGPLSTFLTPADWGGPIVWFHNEEPASAKLIGFTLKNSHTGIAGPVLRFGYASHPTIENCIITDNPGGIYYYYSGAVLKNCLIFGNTTNLLFKFDANRFHPEMINCTIADNKVAVLSNPYSAVKFKNCIIYGNETSGIAGNVDISYSLIEGGFLGDGNIDADPLFVDASNGDYHLQANSPCIDTGTDFLAPFSDIDGNPRPKGAWYDMGAYEAYLPVVLIPYTPDPTNDNTLTLDWWDVVGASTYTLQYSDQSDFSTYTEVTSITESTYEITDELSDGTWYWRVRALDSEGIAGWWTAADNFVVDTIPPTVSSTNPANSATDIALDITIYATFSESVDSITITTDTFTVSTNGSNISGSVSYSEKTAIFIPSNNLVKGTTYTATITTGVKDIAGNSMASNYSWNFTILIPTYTLTISANTGGITEPAPSEYVYNEGTEVTITAYPDANYRFSEWTGDVPSGHENDNPITITIDADKSITANFIRQHELTLTSSSGGTTDPSPGSYVHDSGIQVTIKATPESGYEFSNWSGDASGTTNPITITMDSNKSIKANFSAIPPPEEAGKKGGCFIATAAYGSLLHPYVRILRDFRDKYLMPNKLGRVLVNLYYKYSPFVAKLITRHEALKVVVRISLLPIVAFSYLMLHFGPLITAFMLVFIFVIPILFIWFYQRWAMSYRVIIRKFK